MSFFDQFKRSTQKDSAGKTSPETEKFARAQEAVREFLPILKAKYIAPDRSLHAGTMLSASAWLTGASLYRSFGFTHTDPPGTVIKADQINKEWESLLFMLEGYIFGKADIPVGHLMMAAQAAPEFFQPKVDMLRVQTDLQDQYNAVMKKQGFDYLDGARAGIVLCCAFIQQYDGAKIIDKTASSGIVAQAILEAAKTVPPPLRSSHS
jgi:hypothetical protein